MDTKKQHSVLLLVLVLVLAITFETLQQQYYILRFELAQNVFFWDLLKNQAYRWVLWIFIGFILIPVTKRAKQLNYTFLQKSLFFGTCIIALVFVNIVLIGLIDSALSGDGISWESLWSEYIPFFMFQKSPVYVLGYIAVSIILDQELINSDLQFKIEALSEVKKTNQELYKQLALQQSDKAQVLSIKIGNNRKIIPVSDIIWIASDDYCVIVHTANNAFTMRSSLKQLETTLGEPFLRIHRQAIVNMKAVTQYRASDQSAVLVNNNNWIPVSKKNLRRVKEYLQA